MNTVCAEDISVYEDFETNTAAKSANEFRSADCTAESSENIIIRQNDYRVHGGEYSLSAELSGNKAIELKTTFFGDAYKDCTAELEYYICAAELSDGEKGAEITVKTEIADINGNAVSSSETAVKSDADFNGADNGFVKCSVKADVSAAKDAVIKITAGNENRYPKYVYIDDIKVTYTKNEVPEEEKAEAEPETAALLRYLGVINDGNMKEYYPNKTVTRADFASIMSGFIRDTSKSQVEIVFDDVYEAHYAYEAIKKMSEYGYMNGTGDNKFEPEEPVEYTQAIAVMVKMLGYTQWAEWNGGYPVGYLTAASRISLLKRTPGSGNELTYKKLFSVLDDFIDVKYGYAESVSSSGGGFSVSIAANKDRTILTEVFGLWHDDGVLTSVDSSGISKEGTNKKRGIEIDNRKYWYLGEKAPGEELGYKIEYWYNADGDVEYFYKAANNEELIIEGADFDELSGSNIKYWENDKQKSVSIFGCNVIYNGVYSVFRNDMLDFIEGRLRLIDNDGDGEYNILFIEAYDYMVVGNVNKTDNIISGKYKSGTVNTDSVKNPIIKDINGKSMSMGDIKENDVLRIVVSEEEEPSYIKITVCRKSVNAKAESAELDAEMPQAVFGGTRYEISDWAKSLMEKGAIPEIKIGKNYKLYFDGDKIIAWTLDESTSDYAAAYIIKCALQTGVMSPRFQLRLMTEYGDKESFTCADKVRINGGDKVKSDSEEFINRFKDESGAVMRQLIRYKVNSAGEISDLEFAEKFPESGAVKDKLYKVSDVLTGVFTKRELYYYRNDYSWLDGTIYNVSKEVKMFQMPKSAKYKDDEKFYSVLGIDQMTDYNTSYDPVAYTTLGEYNTVNYLISEIDGSEVVNDKINATMITKVEKILDDYGDERLLIKGISGGNPVSFKADFEGYEDYERLSPGDVIQYALNAQGFVNLVDTRLFKLCLDYDTETGKIIQVTGGWVFECAHWQGLMYNVHKVENGMMYLNRPSNIGSERFNAVFPYGRVQTYVFDTARKKVRKGSMEEAIQYVDDPQNASSVFVTVLDGNMAGIFLYK